MNFSKPSDNTLKLLLEYEVGGGQSYYEKFLSKFTWPGGASGPTIAIGIDCAYYSSRELEELFSFLPQEQISLIVGAVKKTGETGKKYTAELRKAGIAVSWDKAVHIFETHTWPKFCSLAENTFPGLKELHSDAYGAIVSLVFNRGTSLRGDSRLEMRTLREIIPTKKYPNLAQQFRKMKRLWEGKGLDGLIKRREAEAQLIENAL